MMPPTEKYLISLEEAKRHLQTADHLAYITFPLLKENRLLLKVLEELNISLLNAINSILQFEYTYKRIHIYTDARVNLETFKQISSRYNLGKEQLMKLLEVLNLAEQHKKSPFEFAKNDKIVIMSEGMKTETVNLEKVKTYLIEIKDLVRKISIIIQKSPS